MKIDESVQLLRSFIDLSRFSPKMKMRVRPISMVFSNDCFDCCLVQGKWLTNVYQMMCMHFYKENRFPRTTKSRKRSANSWKFSFFSLLLCLYHWENAHSGNLVCVCMCVCNFGVCTTIHVNFVGIVLDCGCSSIS